MMECKFIATPMVTNIKTLSDSALDSDLVDPTMCKKIIKSWMYMVNMNQGIFFAVNTLSQFMVETRHFH